jgi:hypothetical protein
MFSRGEALRLDVECLECELSDLGSDDLGAGDLGEDPQPPHGQRGQLATAEGRVDGEWSPRH